MPWGAIEIDMKGECNISKTNIKRIEKEYDCEFDMIINTHAQCCSCGGDCEEETYTTLCFEKKNVKYRTVKFECQHTFDFDVEYDISKEEFCVECDKLMKIDYKSVLKDMHSIDKKVVKANK